jgi:thiamine-phosphate pyrophosphorylase
MRQVEQLIAGGAKIIQLRDKRASPSEFFEAASDVLGLTRKAGVPLIINDRVDIALVLNADGVHLGQDDLPPDKARSMLGDEAIIGYSTHTLDQAIAAAQFDLDYIAIGPIFPTTTKADPASVVGLDGLRAARQAIGRVPLVAIGGISADNLSLVYEAGAASAAMIGALLAAPASITDSMLRLVNIVEHF